MAFTHTIVSTWKAGDDELVKSETLTGSGESRISESIADSASDLEITFTLDQSAMQSFYMVSDQAITVETNNGAAPTDTFTLAANIPLVWTVGGGSINPVTADITALFITNSSGSAANLEIRALTDSTP